MKNVIIGTAGHIDHGKTALVKALTGTDTDRLKEEKRRGITIELGFTEFPCEEDMDISVIDVPGHVRFIRHMLAGAGRIDIAILAVAADEGFMPQTYEHLAILRMLDIKKGIIAITRTDAADGDMLELVRDDVRENVKGTFLEGAPVAEVSAYTGKGIEELRKLILREAAGCAQRRTDERLLRIPADRVFSAEGFGTVVTGSVIEGSVSAGDEIMIYPSRRRVKIRNLQVHGRDASAVYAGQRAAVNLSGIRRDEIRRGDVLAFPDSMENTSVINVRADMFDDMRHVFRTGSRIRFYCDTREVFGRIYLFDRKSVSEGDSCYAQIRLESPAAVKKDDRFVLSPYSPVDICAGGRILDVSACRTSRASEELMHSLGIRDLGSEREMSELLFYEESMKLSDADMIFRKSGYDPAFITYADEMLREGILKEISEGFIMHRKALDKAGARAVRILEDFHGRETLSPGMPKEEFRERLGRMYASADAAEVRHLADFLAASGVIEESRGMMMLRGFRVKYTVQQEKTASELEDLFMKSGMRPLMMSEAVSGMKDRKTAEQIVNNMHIEGMLVKLDRRYYIHRVHLQKALEMLSEKILEDGSITLAAFRDMTGISRKYAVMILEYADAEDITVMKGDARILCRQEAVWISDR